MARIEWPVLLALLSVAFIAPAGAQGFDCTKAKSPIERAICASPALLDQDRALSDAYAGLLAREPARAGALRSEQRTWLVERERVCASKNEPPARVTACLAGLYRSRLIALAAGPVVTPPARPAGPATPAATPAAAPAPPPPAERAAQVLPPPPPPSIPALPTQGAEPDAVLSQDSVPAAGHTDVMLDVRSPGRFSVRAQSATGVALQLVDMIAGPGEEEGQAGLKDGRIDQLLDRGTYKLRVFGAAKGTGDAKLTVTPFREADLWSGALAAGGQVSTDLADGVQRSFWVQVDKSGRVSVEAVGRSLADLRLWRNGRDLAALEPRLDRVTPRPGRPMTRARLDGQVEAGIYLATAYGGPKLAWTESDPSQPLHLRAGAPEALAGGILEGTIGPAGSARFEAVPGATSFRLELPEPAPATLRVRRGTEPPRVAAVAKNSREPLASLDLSSSGGQPALVEVSGTEGQPFRLRALDRSTSRSVSGVGPHWIAVDVAGEGGDEVPATVLLAQFELGKGGRVLASSAPQIGSGTAWRQKLNLRGATSLIFEVGAAMPVAVTTAGPKVTSRIEPLLGARPPRTDGRSPRYDLEPGWYTLKLEPVSGASGILDLTLGAPGATGATAKAQPSRASIPLGIHNLVRAGNYEIFANTAPGLIVAPVARALPADLAAAPFAVAQAAGQVLELAVRLPPTGALSVAAVDGVPVPVAVLGETAAPNGRTTNLRLPAPERARTVVLSWLDPARRPAVTPPSVPTETETVAAGKPSFFTLGANESKSFSLDVPDGGLYRLETLGRLRTSLTVATSFLPQLDTASANGAGQNALSQSYLRAGRYNVAVKSNDSSGRVGLVARQAQLPEALALTREGSARATLTDGRGATFPIDIAEPGRYRLELFALGSPLRARLEDAEGWPLTTPGPLTSIDRRFEPGRHRLVVLPEPVEARAVARLTALLPSVQLTGHGPHPLAFDRDTAFQWREPAGAEDPRLPDRWEFELAGPADLTLALTEGMAGDLLRVGDTQPVARIVGKAGFNGQLPPGRYALEARSLGRNDRLDYRVTLSTKEIQPGVPRRVELPSTVPFALAEDRVVNLTSFGRTDLRAILKDREGRVIERLDDRKDDWNIALSRPLPAGAYSLELSALPAPPDAKPKPAEENAEGAGVEAEDEPEADTTADEASSDGDGEGGESDTPNAEPAAEAEERASETAPADTGVEIRLALPDVVEGAPLPAEGDRTLEGGAVHRLALPNPGFGALLVVAARSAGEAVLALERQTPSGRWEVVGVDRSAEPLVAAIGDGDSARPWRVASWAVDGGPARIEVASRIVRRDASATGLASFDPVPMDRAASELQVDRVAAPSASILSVQGGRERLLEGSVPGLALHPAGDAIVPQTDAVWLLRRGEDTGPLKVDAAAVPLAGTAMTVPADGRATWPKATLPAGFVRVWRAESTFGQPGLGSGLRMGVAVGSAVAFAGDEVLRVWNAGGSEALPLRVSAHDLTSQPAVDISDGEFSTPVAARSAQELRLPPGPKLVALDLAPGTAAILAGPDGHYATIWSSKDGVSRSLPGEWTGITFANLGEGPGPVRANLAPLGREPSLVEAGSVAKRFVGAAGSLSLRVAGNPGDHLVSVGGAATFIGDAGRVSRGSRIALRGPGELVLDHEPGLLAAWIERPGMPPWPEVASRPADLPSTLTLEGPAMSFSLSPSEPVLVHARTNAPVILSLTSVGRSTEPAMYPAGADFHQLLPAGAARLAVYSPHDGPLGGTLELTATPVRYAGDGLGEPVALAPGAAALFGFEVKRTSQIGVGVRAEPDLVRVRLLDAAGASLGPGLAQLHRLEPGRYILEASVPADGRTTTIRPAIIGLTPPPADPPPDVVREYLQSVGLTPTAPAH